MLHPIDVIDRDNRPTGQQSNPEEASNLGLWHRGARVFIFTSDGHVLVQKRSLTAMQRPGMVDIGAAGFVDTGETPRQAAVRETGEETGLQLSPNDLIFLGMTRYNHRWKFGKQQKISRIILYTYAAVLPPHHAQPVVQQSEVNWVGFLPYRSALWLIHHGSLRRLGKLIPLYAYYNKMLRQARKLLEL